MKNFWLITCLLACINELSARMGDSWLFVSVVLWGWHVSSDWSLDFFFGKSLTFLHIIGASGDTCNCVEYWVLRRWLWPCNTKTLVIVKHSMISHTVLFDFSFSLVRSIQWYIAGYATLSVNFLKWLVMLNWGLLNNV